MLFLLSPAKSLDFETSTLDRPHTAPQFIPQSAELIALLKSQSPQQIASLMKLSDSLAGLNVARYQAWQPKFTSKNAKQAALAFNGDVYGGLDAISLDDAGLTWLQDHVCILSGLYGVMRPLDWMQPYRLEMGTRLPNAKGKDLYAFWRPTITAYLNECLQRDASPVVVNLASNEYFKAVDVKALKAKVVECVFEEYRDGKYKIISFMAKRARGLMARYAALNQVMTPQQLKGFDAEGYVFTPEVSSQARLVFRRDQSAVNDKVKA